MKIKKNRNQRYSFIQNRQSLPGPGSYEIGLPIIKPSYEAIRKNQDIIILKVNDNSQSASFRSNMQRFPYQKQLSPGPAFYRKQQHKSSQKNNYKKLNNKYFELIEIMNRDKSRIEPTPNYTVDYGDQYADNIKSIKNSYRMAKKEKKSLQLSKMRTKNSRISQNSVLTIKSNARYEKNYVQKNNQKQYKTIDYPGNDKKFKASKRSLQEQEKLLLHRKTLYNRNMLGVMFMKGKDNRDKKFN